MKKKIISGLLVVLFSGVLGFVTISEAVGIQEGNRMNTFEMRNGHRRYRGIQNDDQTELDRKGNDSELTKEDEGKIKESREESSDHLYDRRERGSRYHMRGQGGRNDGRMHNSCW